MSGSYSHATTDEGKLRHETTMGGAIETPGDAYETIEEMYGMIWFLANRVMRELEMAHGEDEGSFGDGADAVEEAQQNYRKGLALSPGVETEEEAEEYFRRAGL